MNNNRGLIMDDFQSELALNVFSPSVKVEAPSEKTSEDKKPMGDEEDDWEVIEMTKEEAEKYKK